MIKLMSTRDYKIYDKFIKAQIAAATDPALRAVLIAARSALRAEADAS